VPAKRLKTVDDEDDDIMLPLRQRRLPSFIAIDDTTPQPKPSSDAGFYSAVINVSKINVADKFENIFSASCCHLLMYDAKRSDNPSLWWLKKG